MDFLVGHLVGDYIFQNDWMAANKATPWPGPSPPFPGPEPKWSVDVPPQDPGFGAALESRNARQDQYAREVKNYDEWKRKSDAYLKGWVVCFIHALCYTFAIWLFTQWHWIPLLVTLTCHLVQDRFSLARKLMTYTGHASFRDGVLGPWSAIVYDNTLHLVQLWLVAKFMVGAT